MRICSQVQYLKSGRKFLVIVGPNLRTRSRIVNKWPGQEEAAGDSKVDPIIIARCKQSQPDIFRFRPWWPMKVVARLHLAQMPLSILEQTVYSWQSGSNFSEINGRMQQPTLTAPLARAVCTPIR